jgi:hypothetical protein
MLQKLKDWSEIETFKASYGSAKHKKMSYTFKNTLKGYSMFYAAKTDFDLV